MPESFDIENRLAKAILETSNALIIVMDTEGRVQRFNHGCEKVTGYTEEEVKGRNFWDFLIPEEQMPGVREIFDSLKAQDFPNEHENDWLTKEGERRRIAWSNTAILDDAGEVTHVVGTGLDITQRIAAEAALKRREELYALAQRAANIGSWDWIIETNELIWSETVEDIFGYERDAFPGAYEAFLSRIHPQDRERVVAAIEACLDKDVDYEIEHRIVLPDGTMRWVSEIGDVLHDATGAPERMIGVVQDITERKEAEEALRRERDILDKMMETSPSAITMVNLKGEIVFANSQAEELFQLTKVDITSRTYNAPTWRSTDLEGNLLRDEDQPFQQVLQEKRPLYDMQHVIELPSGKHIVLSINGAPLVDKESQLDGIVFTINDITERTQETKRRIEQLEQEVQMLNASMVSPSNVTAQMFGVKSLRKNFPDIFQQFVARYIKVLELAIEQRVYKVEHPISAELRAIAEHLGSLHAGPRDIVELHTQGLVQVTQDKNGKHTTARDWKAKAYTEEGRLIALELMGYLVSYYQMRCSRDQPSRDRPSPITDQTGGEHAAN